MNLHKITFLILVLFSTSCMAQRDIELTTKSKKAEKAYNKARDYMRLMEYNLAEYELKTAIEKDPQFIEALLLISELYTDTRKTDSAIAYYRKVLNVDPLFFPRAIYNLADLELNSGHYEEAKFHFEQYLESGQVNMNIKNRVQRNLEICMFGIEAMKNPVPFDPVNLGPEVNSPYEEHSPAVTADGKFLLFTLKRPRDEYTECAGCKDEEDFYYSRYENNTWTKARKVKPPLNTHYNEGVQSITPNGNTIYFTRCNRPEGFGSCDLYYAKKTGDTWSEPVNMGPRVNSGHWDSQPSVSADGKSLYFASSRSDGRGNVDIYMTTKDANGDWGRPVNLGDVINTERGEMAPFIHHDNQTLYFISDGHTGMGGMDIFYSRKDSLDNWSEPVNIGYPINTFADERSLTLNTRGDYAYFSSNLPGGQGKYDLYYFEVYPEARPIAATFLKGIVFDKKSLEKLEATFELLDIESADIVVSSTSDAVTGEFLEALPTNRNYALNVSREGYLFYSDHFALKGEHSKVDPFLMDIPLTPIEVNSSMVLRNIFFETDKYNLKKESRLELDRLVALMEKNPEMKIEIGGHTDNIGSESHNLTLSKNRAKAVYEYLAGQGIDPDRMTYKGYGYSQPIDTNDTPEGRAKNRRTQFTVIAL